MAEDSKNFWDKFGMITAFLSAVGGMGGVAVSLTNKEPPDPASQEKSLKLDKTAETEKKQLAKLQAEKKAAMARATKLQAEKQAIAQQAVKLQAALAQRQAQQAALAQQQAQQAALAQQQAQQDAFAQQQAMMEQDQHDKKGKGHGKKWQQEQSIEEVVIDYGQ